MASAIRWKSGVGNAVGAGPAKVPICRSREPIIDRTEVTFLREKVARTHYRVDGRPKSVAYFLMDTLDDVPAVPEDTGEVESIEWKTPREAIAVLTHEDDRDLVTKIFNVGESSG